MADRILALEQSTRGKVGWIHVSIKLKTDHSISQGDCLPDGRGKCIRDRMRNLGMGEQ